MSRHVLPILVVVGCLAADAPKESPLDKELKRLAGYFVPKAATSVVSN